MNDASSDPGIPGRPGDVVAAAAPREVGALVFRPLEIDTWQEHVIYMHPDCPVCRAEGFSAQARVRVQIGDRSLIATLTLLGAPLLNTDRKSVV